MILRRFIFFLVLGLISCKQELVEESFPKTYQCECKAIEDTLTFQKFSSVKDSNFILINAPIDSINQLIIAENIVPFEKNLREGKRQLWWHNGHPIKIITASKWAYEDRVMQNTFYIFDNCNGAHEFHKLDTLTPQNLITHRLYFYENRKAKYLFVEAMTPSGRTHIYNNIKHVEYAKKEAKSRLQLLESILER